MITPEPTPQWRVTEYSYNHAGEVNFTITSPAGVEYPAWSGDGTTIAIFPSKYGFASSPERTMIRAALFKFLFGLAFPSTGLQ